MNAQVLCRLRPGHTEKFRIKEGESIVGRQSGLAISLPTDSVSRRHARISFEAGHYWIENLSAAGTFINGRLVQRERLRHLDVVTLGKSLDLLFVLREEALAAVPREGITRAALLPEGADATPYEVPVGEITIGRSSSNNVVAESGSVSKVHARLRRTALQFVIQDLGSANGTFVNGARVMTALLNVGDLISLGNIVNYRVVVERGTVASTGEAPLVPEPGAEPTPEDRPRFSGQWKTRYTWDSGEIRNIAELQQRMAREGEERQRDRMQRREASKKAVAPAKAEAPKRPAVVKPADATVRPAPSIARPPAAPVAKPAADAPAVPAAKAPANPTPVAPPAEAAPAAQTQPAAPPKSAAAGPAPAPSAPASPAQALAKPSSTMAAAPGKIAEVRFEGADVSLAVAEAGSFEFGRAAEAALRIRHATVSRRHARIVLSPDRGVAQVEDLAGRGSTQLNGTAVTEARTLRDGDEIVLGEIRLKVRIVRT